MAVFARRQTLIVIAIVAGLSTSTLAHDLERTQVMLMFDDHGGFVLDVSPENRESLPMWMRVKGIAELKNTLVSAILVYLAVDVTTDFSQSSEHPPWQILAKPLTILLIAAAFRLSAASHSEP